MGDDRSSAGPTGDPAAVAAKQNAAAYVGQVVGGRYRVDAILALGGMGAVFRAEHVHMRKEVALKILHPTTENLPELVTRFERESIVGAHVTHPNVCQATDFGRLDDGSHYLVLEYVEGRTLHDVLKEGPLEPARAAEIARQIASGLGAAHALGIYHRDVKPSNLMLIEGPRVLVKIVDFGLAKLPAQRFHVDEKITVTTAGTVFGTVAYMAPELARGMHVVDHRSDLYALGVVLYQMLAGKHPFSATEPVALFKQHCKEPPPPMAERAPGATVPPALERVARKLLEKEPADRYQSTDELIAALDEACAPEPASHPASPAPAKPSSRLAAEPEEPSEASPPAPAAADGAPPRRRASSVGLWLVALGAVAVGAVIAVRSFAPEVWAKLGIEAPPIATPASPDRAASPPAEPPTAAPSSPSGSVSVAAPAQAAPPASASAVVGASTAAPVSPEVLRLRGVLSEAAAAHEAKRGALTLIALARAAPEAFRDHDVIANAAAIAVVVELGDRATADEVFATLAGPSLGESGPDVLLYVTSFYGGSRGATHAAELLAKPEVLARASPALRVARDLKNTGCKDRPALFDRAAADGDERALTLLTAMLAPECDETQGACCAPHDARLAAATARLRQRVRK